MMTIIKIVFYNELLVAFLLSSLLDSWRTLVLSISNCALESVLSLDVIKKTCSMKKLEEN